MRDIELNLSGSSKWLEHYPESREKILSDHRDSGTPAGYHYPAGAALGPSNAGHVNIAGLCDFITLNENTASTSLGGTHLVKASLATDITPIDLGGEQVHAKITGVADQTAQDDVRPFSVLCISLKG
jgi:hypothetical protein